MKSILIVESYREFLLGSPQIYFLIMILLGWVLVLQIGKLRRDQAALGRNQYFFRWTSQTFLIQIP